MSQEDGVNRFMETLSDKDIVRPRRQLVPSYHSRNSTAVP